MSHFLQLVQSRHSCRNYDSRHVIPDHVLNECIDAAILSPSACNRQPWSFTIVRADKNRAQLLEKALLPGIKHDWLYNAPCIVALSVKRETVTHRLAPKLSGIPYPYVDAGIAGEHFILAATERGLGTCWIGWIRAQKARQALALPRSEQVVALIAVGYPAQQEHVPHPSPRPRKPRDEIVRWL